MSKPLLGPTLIRCNNCGARDGKLVWSPDKKAWCCPTCGMSIPEYEAKIAREAAE